MRRLVMCFDGTWNQVRDQTNVSRIHAATAAIPERPGGAVAQLKSEEMGGGVRLPSVQRAGGRARRRPGRGAATAPSARDAHAGLRSLADAGLPIGFACPAAALEAAATGVLPAPAKRLGDCLDATLAAEDAEVSMKLLGWLLTALAVTLRAPFWFDAMKRLVNLRSTGPRPGKAA